MSRSANYRKKGKGNKHNGGGFRHSKSLGQNFLEDMDIVREIVEGSMVDRDTVVIEIGPGQGVLTAELAEEAGRVIAIELDDRLIPELKARFIAYDNVEIVHGDILETDVRSLIENAESEYGLTKARVIGNLPYYITTPIITSLITGNLPVLSVTAMMQKEVADRLIAKPGTSGCGVVTYLVQYYTEVTRICEAGREAFYPAPKVDSTVLRMDMLPEPPVTLKNEKVFFQCIKAGFSLRRKTLLNSLSAAWHMDKKSTARILEKGGIDPERRAETLTMEEFVRLADSMEEESNR